MTIAQRVSDTEVFVQRLYLTDTRVSPTGRGPLSSTGELLLDCGREVTHRLEIAPDFVTFNPAYRSAIDCEVFYPSNAVLDLKSGN